MQLRNRQLGIMTALILLMAATRMHHYGSALHLPDASLAVFLLAGFFIASPLFFAGLLLEAGVLDYVATTYLSVSDWCITPAYWFLIPTYAVVWYAGRFYARTHRPALRSLGAFAGISIASLTAAFLISNGSFYWFSGRISGVSFSEYISGVAQFYLPHMSGSLLYLACAAALYAVLTARAPDTSKAG